MTVKGSVGAAHYAPGPLSFKSEAEDGIPITDGEAFELQSNSSIFPSFSERGYINIMNEEGDVST